MGVRGKRKRLAARQNRRNVLESSKNGLEYRHIELPNGLCALLVHDSEISETQAAAALTIEVGSSMDPEEAYGLAHLLEHVIFCGSKTFPGVDEFESFLKDHGGESNATTGIDRTLFHFDVNTNFFHQALKRFAACIVSPLLREENIMHEISAVDAEFLLNSQEDSLRLMQLRRHTSPLNHPFNRFVHGNRDSLVDASRKLVLGLHHQYYRGDRMKLVLMGGESLDILQQWAHELFGEIKRGVDPEPHKGPTVPKFPIWPHGKIYRVNTSSGDQSLHLMWSFPVLKDKGQNKVHDYVSYLIKAEGEGGLVASLKATGLVRRVDVSPSCADTFGTSIAYLFCMDIDLTDSGLNKIFDVIGMIYQYLNLLRSQGPISFILEELQASAELKFLLEKPEFNIGGAEELVEKLRLSLPDHIFHGDFSYENLDEELKEFLKFLTPMYMRVDVVNRIGKKRKRNSLVQKEPWYDSLYAEEEIPDSLMDLWVGACEMGNSFKFPSKNHFILSSKELTELSEYVSDKEEFSQLDEDLIDSIFGEEKFNQFGEDLIELSDKDINKPPSANEDGHDMSNMEISYLWKVISTLPEVRARLDITLRGACDNSRNALHTRLFMHLLQGEVRGIIHKATVAGLEIWLGINDDTLTLSINCLAHKLYVVLKNVLQVILSIASNEDRFSVGVQDLEKALKKGNFKPSDYCNDLMMQLLTKNFCPVEDKLEVLQDKDLYKSFTEFIPQLFSQVYIKADFTGQLPREEFIKINELLKDRFKQPPIQDRYENSALLLHPHRTNFIIHRRVKNRVEPNSAVTLYFQIGVNNSEEYAKAMLFHKFVEPKFFHEMRTLQQLCYSPECSTWSECGVLGYIFAVISPRFDPPYVLEKIESFVDGIEDILHEKEYLLETFKNDLEDILLDPDLSFPNEETETDDESCRRLAQSLTLEQVIKWYKRYIKGKRCKKIAFCIWGGKTGKIVKDFQSAQVIESIEDFKKGSGFHTL